MCVCVRVCVCVCVCVVCGVWGVSCCVLRGAPRGAWSASGVDVALLLGSRRGDGRCERGGQHCASRRVRSTCGERDVRGGAAPRSRRGNGRCDVGVGTLREGAAARGRCRRKAENFTWWHAAVHRCLERPLRDLGSARCCEGGADVDKVTTDGDTVAEYGATSRYRERALQRGGAAVDKERPSYGSVARRCSCSTATSPAAALATPSGILPPPTKHPSLERVSHGAPSHLAVEIHLHFPGPL